MKKLTLFLLVATLAITVTAFARYGNQGNGRGQGPGIEQNQNAGYNSPCQGAYGNCGNAAGAERPCPAYDNGTTPCGTGGCAQGNRYNPYDEETYYEIPDAEEQSDLITMLNEEKLARDVYAALYESTGLRPFYMISMSEQRHMYAVKSLLDKYDIVTTVYDMEPGQFSDETIANLYTKLVEKGQESAEEAVKVGGYIEELDIKDLRDSIEATNKEGIKAVYERLLAGSYNHLKAFARGYEYYGMVYDAQYLTQEEVDEILNGQYGGYGSKRGEVQKQCQGRGCGRR
ncbi:DUF2202 domain-containing protein [Limisalsivibrio acetivorans]|uniref:DUF2202 domain-containing protein n=1 Tax=Limisalsivibrio acetivorans TaxID=1304888 RepID=UPI0003B42477|nr:DUF2202 domain-containing protein [Limisalsivibrio acetivorans]